MTYRRWFSIVFTVLVATLILLAIGLSYVIRIVADPGYPASSLDPAVQLQDNAFVWHDRACEILVYGDSSADIGIDPRVLTAHTGLSACNIATNRPIVDTLDMLPVDAFLAHNPKPKLLVLQFGPEVFFRSRTPWQNAGPYSPMVLLIRDTPRAFALRTMLKHPSDATAFILYMLQMHFFPHHFDLPLMHRLYAEKIAHAEASNGQLQLDAPPLDTCTLSPLKLYGPVDTAWVRQLHRKYESRGIAVLVRASPVPSCDPQLQKFQSDLAPVVDENVEPLPLNSFVEGGRHTTQAGSQTDTLDLVHFIQAHKPGLVGVPTQ